MGKDGNIGEIAGIQRVTRDWAGVKFGFQSGSKMVSVDICYCKVAAPGEINIKSIKPFKNAYK